MTELISPATFTANQSITGKSVALPHLADGDLAKLESMHESHQYNYYAATAHTAKLRVVVLHVTCQMGNRIAMIYPSTHLTHSLSHLF